MLEYQKGHFVPILPSVDLRLKADLFGHFDEIEKQLL